MKSRLDAPHLEKLRYDYQLLHECYSPKRPMRSAIESILVLAALASLPLWAILWGVL